MTEDELAELIANRVIASYKDGDANDASWGTDYLTGMWHVAQDIGMALSDAGFEEEAYRIFDAISD